MVLLVSCSMQESPKKNPQVNPQTLTNPSPIDSKVNQLLSQMTTEEKIGQLALYSTDWQVTGPSVPSQYMDAIKEGKVGAIFNAYTTDFTRRLQEIAVENSRLKIPLLFGFDVIHGFKTIFPIPLGEAASWDLDLMEKSARVAATEAAAAGLHWTFAPMIDVARDPRWGRVAEGAGEDTFFGSKVAAARVRGFQGKLGDDDSVLACAKHFAAYGAAEGGRDYNTVDVSLRTLREVYLPPFKAAADAGVETFMTAFNEISGVPSTSNHWLLQDVLRGEWGFKGFVVSDYTSVNELVPHGVAENEFEAGRLAFNAGVDMDMAGGIYARELPNLMEQDAYFIPKLNQAAGRILRLKHKLGLFEDPYKYFDRQREQERVFSEEHQKIARDVARRSIVLLKNEHQTLPIAQSLKSIALIGPLGKSRTEPLGSWSGAGRKEGVVTLFEGIKKRLPEGARLVYSKGSEIDSDDRSGFAAALKVAENAEVVIAALGEAASMSGEAASRSSLDLPGVQLELLKELAALGKPMVLVLMNGRPLKLNWADEHVPAILETWFLGSQTGHAIADVLFGDYNPSGKLPISFPRNEGQVPVYYNAKNTGRPFSASEKYTSKYLDIENTPLYPFGFGLSYTQFVYRDLKVNKTTFTDEESIEVQVDVMNSGEVEGLETVQLYLTDLVASVTRPVKELKGFQQVLLSPGEKKTVRFVLNPEDLSFYNIKMEKVVEPGSFRVQVGGNSRDLLAEKFEIR